ncbi:TonB-dependent receptor [bacterium]|nr:TonB-dependent receptor [bacterium]
MVTCLAFAGTTGKIAGKITDKATGAPLAGVNIVIEGTMRGTASDVNGNYVILHIPPGTYSLKATMIGYGPMTVKEVRVKIDLTTRVDMQLTEQVVEGQGVTIIAESKLIQEDEVSTRHYISADEMTVMPVDNFQEIAKNQAGVVGNHFRGGRSNEVLVLIDGIPVKDPAGTYSDGVTELAGFTGDVPEFGIQELEVSLGGFGAEYGNVQSGVLNVALKEGRQKYAGNLRFTSTDFGTSSMTTQLLQNIYEISLNGPEPVTSQLLRRAGINLPGALTFSLSGEITDKDQGYYLNQQSYNQSFQGKLTYKISPTLKLTYGRLLSKRNWDEFYFPASKYGPGPDYPENEYQYVDNNRLMHYIYVNDPTRYTQGEIQNSEGIFEGNPYSSIQTYYVGGMQDYLWNRMQRTNLSYLIWTHALNPRTYYEISFNDFYSNYHYATPDMEDRDGDGNTEEDLVWDINKDGPHPIYREQESNYWWVRGDDPGYRDQQSWTRSLQADLVTQATANHLLKTGLELFINRTKTENISWTLNLTSLRKDIWDQQNMDLGIFVQDKIEFEGISALVGLRFDTFNPNGFDNAAYFPGDYHYPYEQVDENDVPVLLHKQKAKSKYQLSPRLGISHPITDRDILHFTYGHYFQRPDAYFLYRNYKIQSLTKVGNFVGNPDLKPEKTVAYEVGYEHLITDDIKATVTGYYKDVTNLMNWRKYVARSIQDRELNVYTNADYGNIKGLEFTLTRRIGRYWGAQANYTFSVAKGRSSSYNGGSGSFTDAKRMNILDHDQTHTVNANLTLQTPSDFGPRLGSVKPLADWIMNVQFEYGSGLPYSSYGTGKINDKRMPWTSTTDLKLIRKISVANLTFELFFDVYNLFDRKNVWWIGNTQYYDQGDPNDPTIKGDPSVVRRDNITGDYVRNPTVFSYARQFRFGMAVKL